MGYFNDDEAKNRQIILEHYEDPDNKIEDFEKVSNYESFNNKSSSCIDNLTLYIKIENNIISDVKFGGIGCAISTASTDIASNLVIGKTKQEASKIIDEYLKMIDGQECNLEILENLSIFKNISKQLNRIKCAKVGVVAIKKIIAN